MKIHQLATLLWLASAISGQTLVDVRTQTKNVDFSGAASTIPAKSGSALPLSCKLGEMFFNTSNAPGQNLYLCAPANTWTILVSGTSSTTGTILAATNGQFAFYGTNGSTVGGHTLVAGDIPALNYQSPLSFTGSGSKTASSTGSVAANNCAKWDANGNIVDAGSSCGAGSAKVLQVSSHIAEGDSITAGYDAGGVANVTNLAAAYPALLAASEGSTLTDRGTSGSQACDMMTLETNKDSSTIDNNSALYTMMIGTNDAHTKGTGAYEAVFQNCHKAAIAWDAVGNKYAANSTNCTDTGAWSAHIFQSPSLTGEDTFTVGATKSCSIFTPAGTLYAWYWEQDGSTGAFTYAVDGGTPVALTVAQNPAISTQNGGSYGYGLIRVIGLTPNTAHTILFTSTTGTAANSGVGIIAFGTPPAQGTYGAPRVFVGGVPKQQGDAQSAISAQYNADVLADVSLLASDGLNVSFVPVRNYLCALVTSGVCYNAYGVADMNTPAFDPGGFHPNTIGQNDLKQAFADTEQFTPFVTAGAGGGSGTVSSGAFAQFGYYSAAGTTVSGHSLAASDIPALSYDASGAAAAVLATSLQKSNNLSDLVNAASARTNLGLGTAATQASSAFQSPLTFTGTGSQAISGTGAGANGNCAKWDANGNVVDAGLPCGSGGGGVGSSTSFSSVTAGTNTAALVMGSGGSLGTSGTGTIAATSVPASGVTGLLADSSLPSDHCTLTKYSVAYTALTAAASAAPTSTLLTLPSTSTRVCFVEISGATSFTGAGITATTVRLQSGAATPLLYSPNQDVFGIVGPTTNNFWSDSGSAVDRTNLTVNAAFTITGATSSALTAGSVNIVVGTRTVPY